MKNFYRIIEERNAIPFYTGMTAESIEAVRLEFTKNGCGENYGILGETDSLTEAEAFVAQHELEGWVNKTLPGKMEFVFTAIKIVHCVLHDEGNVSVHHSQFVKEWPFKTMLKTMVTEKFRAAFSYNPNLSNALDMVVRFDFYLGKDVATVGEAIVKNDSRFDAHYVGVSPSDLRRQWRNYAGENGWRVTEYGIFVPKNLNKNTEE